MPQQCQPDHNLKLDFKQQTDIQLIVHLAKNGPLSHVANLDRQLCDEIGHGSTFIFHKVASGYGDMNEWNDGRKWELISKNEAERITEEGEVGSKHKGPRLHRKYGEYEDPTGKHWVVTYFHEGAEKELVVMKPEGAGRFGGVGV
ncbi:MAG: hypothetical protein M1823_003814 [Watsoniomyces obsoletus]|nr:MAG: hypothetical protein M1823_003814 [Watsoniomyces obsoletus]